MPVLEVVHEATHTARPLNSGNQRADEQREDQHPGVARIGENTDRTFQAPGDAGQRVELIEQRMRAPNTGEE